MIAKLFTAVAATSLTLALSSCVVAIGAGRQAPPTKGQELQDLKRAYDSGAISNSEYREQRAKILHDE